MGWAALDIKEWTRRLSAAFEAWLPGVDARLARNNVGPTATAVGGALWQIDAKMEEIARDRFVHLASTEALTRHGADFGLPRKSAVAAAGRLSIVSTGASSIEAGALFRRADGTRFRVTSAAAISGTGTYETTIVALVAGTAANTDAGSTLTALSGVVGTIAATVGAGGIVGGAEIEAVEAYRTRLLERLAYPPQGGTTSDYWRWATSVDGCTGCFVWPRRGGVGRVTLWPVFDGRRAGGLPTTAELALVREAVEASAPDGALITVAAFTPHVVDVTIPGLQPSTQALRDTIAAEIANTFAARARISGGAEAHPSFPMRATPHSFSRSWIEEAISRAVGEVRHGPISPAADITLADGERAVLGTITWT